MKPHIPVAAVLCAVGLSTAPVVRAEIPDKQDETAETSGKPAIKPVPLILSGSRGTFEISLNRDTETRIIFPGDIRYSGAVRSHPRIKVDHRYDELRIHLRDAATPADKLNVMVETANELVSLRLPRDQVRQRLREIAVTNRPQQATRSQRNPQTLPNKGLVSE